MKKSERIALSALFLVVPLIIVRCLDQANGGLIILLGASVMAPTFGLTLFVLKKRRTWALKTYDWLNFSWITPILWVLMAGSVAGMGMAGKELFFPTATLQITVRDEPDILVTLWDPSRGLDIGAGRKTDDFGDVVFDHVSFGIKKVYLLRRLPNSNWEYMEKTLDVNERKASLPLNFKPRKAQIISLPPIQFDTSESDLNIAGLNLLDGLRLKLENERGRLLVLGNTDEKGGDDYNDKLGKERAASVVKLLREFKFDPNRIRAFTFGRRWQIPPTSPTASVSQIREANRRVELLFIPPSTDGTE